MTTFSERYGYGNYRPLDPILEDAPDWLRIGFGHFIVNDYISYSLHEHEKLPADKLCILIAYKFKVGEYTIDEETSEQEFLTRFYKFGPWNHFYDFIELIAEELLMKDFLYPLPSDWDRHGNSRLSNYQEKINAFFQENNVGWRMDDNGLLIRGLPIELQSRIDEIRIEMNDDQPVLDHYEKALRFITQRPLDPENSIKEIISALESLTRLYYPGTQTLGDVVDKMKNGNPVPKVLAQMIEKFYAFANSSPNIRHGAPEESTVTLSDAEFCLHVGAAMLRYLKAMFTGKEQR